MEYDLTNNHQETAAAGNSNMTAGPTGVPISIDGFPEVDIDENIYIEEEP